MGFPIAVGTAMALGSILNLVSQGYGMWKQEKENAATREQSTKWRNEDIAREQAELKREWRWKEEEKKYKKQLDFVNGMSNMLTSDVSLKNNLTQIWRR